MTALFSPKALLEAPQKAQWPQSPKDHARLAAHLTAGHSPDAQHASGQTTALTWAMRTQQFAVAEQLVAHGANPFLEDPNGMTAFEYGVERNAPDAVMETLLHWGVQHPQAANGWMAAIDFNDVHLVEGLLRHGWLVDALAPVTQDRAQATGLSRATSWEMFQVLVSAGANPEHQDAYGYTALQRVRENNPGWRDHIVAWQSARAEAVAVQRTVESVTTPTPHRKPRL